MKKLNFRVVGGKSNFLLIDFGSQYILKKKILKNFNKKKFMLNQTIKMN